MSNENYLPMFSDELTNITEIKRSNTLTKNYLNDTPKNIDPLTELPIPKMRLFGISKVFKSIFFDTEEELNKYIKNHNSDFSNTCIIEYLGSVAGCSDVIRLTSRNKNTVLYTPVDEDGYGIYNNERSIYKGEYIWEYHHGNISEMYSAFRKRGIVFKDDTYAKIEQRNKEVMELFDKYNQFSTKINKRQVLSYDKGYLSPLLLDAKLIEKKDNNTEYQKYIEEMAKIFRRNNFANEGAVLKKTLKK